MASHVKKQVQLVGDQAVTVNTATGPLGLLDRLKSYYHTLITIVGGVLVVANQVVAIAGWIPGYGTVIAGWVSAGIVGLTALSNFLKSNEHWVDDIP